MGCKQSAPKGSVILHDEGEAVNRNSGGGAPSTSGTSSSLSTQIDLPPEIQKISDPGQQLYHLLKDTTSLDPLIWTKVVKICEVQPSAVRYQHPETLLTALHLACCAIGAKSTELQMDTIGCSSPDAVRALIKAYPDALSMEDANGCIPLHYAVCPSNKVTRTTIDSYFDRSEIVKILVASDYEVSMEYLTRSDVTVTGKDGCTPLYLAVASIPDDFHSHGATTFFIRAVHEANPSMVVAKNDTNFDKPLSLLYRRFSRQFDFSEKFFPGDNSRTEVLEHRNKYKAAAVNTWKIIQCLLRPTQINGKSIDTMDASVVAKGSKSTNYLMVHAAVQTECPPDLLRYIIETRSTEVQKPNKQGRLPLHLAAMTQTNTTNVANMQDPQTNFSAYHSKFVIDELLYSYADGATEYDHDGKLPLQLAIESGKSWIGGGIRSLYNVFPDARKKIDLGRYPFINDAMSTVSDYAAEDDDGSPGIEKEENYDAIMRIQKNDVDLGDVLSIMWANEEDAGIQMLGCITIFRIAMVYKEKYTDDDEASQVLPVATSSIAAIVNAMKNHPNEPAVQEKACSALLTLSHADAHLEISFAASGAVASIVAAMQAHVSDSIVQEVACAALRSIVKVGGADRATVVASVSGFTAIQNAMGAHPDVVGVQKEACQALLELTAFSSDANLPDLPTGQLSPLLDAALSRFPSECEEAAKLVLLRLS